MKFSSAEFFKSLQDFAVGKSIDCFKKKISMKVTTLIIIIDNCINVNL